MRAKNDTVKFKGITPQMLRGLAMAEALHQQYTGREAVVTSLNDGRHMDGSKHYSGNAADLRVWYTDAKSVTKAYAYDLAANLGPDYQVVYGTKGHTDHIHFEFDPKAVV